MTVSMPDMRGPVLVVDDEPHVCRLVRMVLEGAGYEVREAGSASEALRLIREHQPALLLLDLMMPGRSGLDLLGEIRQQPATADLPVVVVTAVGVQQDLDQAAALGARATLAKPFSRAQLLQAVEQALQA